ncbi:MAG: Ig-like domain-containing protein [Ruminococcus sp.]|nr:Ig-like domain-containing protein [Ruminococcus sp.]
MSISKKLLSTAMAVMMVISLLTVVPTATAAESTVRINEVNAKVGQNILYDFYVQAGTSLKGLEGKINYDKSVLTLSSLTYDVDSSIKGTETKDGDIVTYSFSSDKTYDATSRIVILTAMFKVSATSSKYTSSTTADAVSACFTKLTSTSGVNLMESANTNITTRTIIAPTSVTMKSTSVNLVGKGDKEVVYVKSVGPVNSDVQSSYACTYKSSNTNVAKVTNRSTKVTITAVGPGTCYVYCTTDGNLATAKIKVTVTQPVTKVTLNSKPFSLKKGASKSVKVTVSPTNASNKNVSVKSSKSGIVKLSASTVKSGKTVKITAKKKGSTTLTFQAKDGSKKKATIKITVK